MFTTDRTLVRFNAGELKNWSNLEDIEIFVEPNVGYLNNYLSLASVDKTKNEAHSTMLATYPMGKVDKHLHAMDGGIYRAENVINYLDTPGE